MICFLYIHGEGTPTKRKLRQEDKTEIMVREVVLQRAYPYENVSKVPMKYDAVHVEIAAYMINKRGAEGEVSHSENGVSRTYEDGDIPPSLLRAITPVVGVL